MKYKIIGGVSLICVILLSLLALTAVGDASMRVHQHLEAVGKDESSRSEGELSTHLPLVEIDTGGIEIPGSPVRDSETGVRIGFSSAADGSTTIGAHIKVIDNASQYNHPGDTPALESDIRIRVRGNSSRSFDKKSYKIRLIDESGENNPQAMMGMGAHHEWALHGPYLDKTLIRNYMWYNIAGSIMDYAPNVRFCEVIIDGVYKGLYVMTETITAGQDGARLQLSVDKKDSTFSGYCFRLDWGDGNELSTLNNFTTYTLRAKTEVEIVYPGNKSLTPEIVRAIEQDISDFEKALYSYDYDNAKYGADTFIDEQSFIDYFLINELTVNYDAGWLSTYMYKDTDGLYRMCVWDFNSACDYYRERVISTHHFEMQDCLWFFMLLKDEDFTDALIKRYWELRKSYFNEEYLMSYIDDTVEYLGDAVERNFSVWGYSFMPEHDYLKPSSRNVRNHDEAIAQLKGFLHERIRWMDDNIEILRQYSAESKVKKFNENAN